MERYRVQDLVIAVAALAVGTRLVMLNHWQAHRLPFGELIVMSLVFGSEIAWPVLWLKQFTLEGRRGGLYTGEKLWLAFLLWHASTLILIALRLKIAFLVAFPIGMSLNLCIAFLAAANLFTSGWERLRFSDICCSVLSIMAYLCHCVFMPTRGLTIAIALTTAADR